MIVAGQVAKKEGLSKVKQSHYNDLQSEEKNHQKEASDLILKIHEFEI